MYNLIEKLHKKILYQIQKGKLLKRKLITKKSRKTSIEEITIQIIDSISFSKIP